MMSAAGCHIQDFVSYIRHSCHTVEDRGHCTDLLNELPLTDSEKAYCRGALERYIRWIMPHRVAMDLPPPGPRAAALEWPPYSLDAW